MLLPEDPDSHPSAGHCSALGTHSHGDMTLALLQLSGVKAIPHRPDPAGTTLTDARNRPEAHRTHTKLKGPQEFTQEAESTSQQTEVSASTAFPRHHPSYPALHPGPKQTRKTGIRAELSPVRAGGHLVLCRSQGYRILPAHPEAPQDPHSPHPSTPASCRGREFAEPERADKNLSHLVWREGGSPGGRLRLCDGAQLPSDFIHKIRPCPGWSLLPEGFLSSYLFTSSPRSHIGCQETSLDPIGF